MNYERKMQAVLKVLERPRLSMWALDYWHDVYFQLAKAQINETETIPRTIH